MSSAPAGAGVEFKLSQPTSQIMDRALLPERARESISPVLSYAAGVLGACEAAVLFRDGRKVEITDRWSTSREYPRTEGSLQSTESLCRAYEDGVEQAGSESPLARDLRQSVASNSRSFLLFHWQLQPSVMTVVFGFTSPTPLYQRISKRASDISSLVCLTRWSLKEAARLRVELEIVNNRLAERKLVERAKGLLQAERGFNEEQAYEYLRGISRRRRITLGALAEEVLSNQLASDPRQSQFCAREF